MHKTPSIIRGRRRAYALAMEEMEDDSDHTNAMHHRHMAKDGKDVSKNTWSAVFPIHTLNKTDLVEFHCPHICT